MKRTFFVLMILLVSHQIRANPCFEISAEWLYMLSSIEQPEYVQTGDGSSNITLAGGSVNGKRKANEQSWHSGYRLEGLYYFPKSCNYLDVRWTSFNFNEKDHFEGLFAPIAMPPIFQNLGTDEVSFLQPGSARIEDHYKFYYIDLLFGHSFHLCDCFIFTVDAGAQYVHLDFNEKIDYLFTAGSPFARAAVTYSSQNRRIGPELSVSTRYSPCKYECLAVVARTSFALLASRQEAKETLSGSTTGSFTSKNDPYWLLSPTYNMRFGLNYTKTIAYGCKCLNYELEVGYEFIEIFKGVNRITHMVDESSIDQFSTGERAFLNFGRSFNEYMDFALHGPYVRLSSGF